MAQLWLWTKIHTKQWLVLGASAFQCMRAGFLCPKNLFNIARITIGIDCNGFSLLIFEEKRQNYASRPKSTPNSDLFWVRPLFNVCVWVFCAPNTRILLVYIPAKIKMSKKMIFFAKIGIFCKSILGPLPCVVQAYTQP